MFLPAATINTPLRTDEDGVIRVGRTRVTLQSVVDDIRRGASPEEIVHHYPALDLADAYLVVGYYLQNREEIDAYVQEQRDLAREARREYEAKHPNDPLREKLRSRLNKS
jgi:uncharacterized protein (DUF433 family)